jgi:hypothetical protein
MGQRNLYLKFINVSTSRAPVFNKETGGMEWEQQQRFVGPWSKDFDYTPHVAKAMMPRQGSARWRRRNGVAPDQLWMPTVEADPCVSGYHALRLSDLSYGWDSLLTDWLEGTNVLMLVTLGRKAADVVPHVHGGSASKVLAGDMRIECFVPFKPMVVTSPEYEDTAGLGWNTPEYIEVTRRNAERRYKHYHEKDVMRHKAIETVHEIKSMAGKIKKAKTGKEKRELGNQLLLLLGINRTDVHV